jgi:hypothetical protein
MLSHARCNIGAGAKKHNDTPKLKPKIYNKNKRRTVRRGNVSSHVNHAALKITHEMIKVKKILHAAILLNQSPEPLLDGSLGFGKPHVLPRHTPKQFCHFLKDTVICLQLLVLPAATSIGAASHLDHTMQSSSLPPVPAPHLFPLTGRHSCHRPVPPPGISDLRAFSPRVHATCSSTRSFLVTTLMIRGLSELTYMCRSPMV